MNRLSTQYLGKGIALRDIGWYNEPTGGLSAAARQGLRSGRKPHVRCVSRTESPVKTAVSIDDGEARINEKRCRARLHLPKGRDANCRQTSSRIHGVDKQTIVVKQQAGRGQGRSWRSRRNQYVCVLSKMVESRWLVSCNNLRFTLIGTKSRDVAGTDVVGHAAAARCGMRSTSRRLSRRAELEENGHSGSVVELRWLTPVGPLLNSRMVKVGGQQVQDP